MQLLIIDDDPDVGLFIHQLFPTATIHTAEHGLVGLQLARKLHHLLDLVILDIKMPPYDGVHVALQIRHDLPHLKILPYSYSRNEDALFQSIGGMAPLVAKPAPAELLRQRILEAAAMPPPPPPAVSPALTYLRQQAIQQEYVQTARDHVAVLLSSGQLARLFQPTLAATQRSWYVAFSLTQLQDMMEDIPATLLIADTGCQSGARALAARRQLPLLLIAFSVADGYRALYFAEHVMLWLNDTAKLNHALERIKSGQPYVDPTITARLQGSGLNAGEQAMIPLLLQGLSVTTISAMLAFSEGTVRKYSSHVFTALGCTTSGELFEALNQPTR